VKDFLRRRINLVVGIPLGLIIGLLVAFLVVAAGGRDTPTISTSTSPAGAASSTARGAPATGGAGLRAPSARRR